jgi:hypothetical protein
MAVSTTHDVAAQDVLDELTFNTEHVGATTSPLSTTMIDQWVIQAAGQLNAIMTRHAIDPTTLGDDEAELVRAGVIAYAAAKALTRTHGAEADVRRQWETWGSVRKTLRETPQDLGASQLAENQIVSNIDVDNPTPKRWNSANFGGW